MTDTHELLHAAGDALQKAHAPYSKLKVGAAVRSTSGRIYSGCNVESVAFPVGGCAEHHAIAAAVRAEGPTVRLTAVAVRAIDGHEREVPIPPCGGCRQLIHEFGPAAKVTFLGLRGQLVTFGIGELLPESFTFDP
jgi:cytidine deaminase